MPFKKGETPVGAIPFKSGQSGNLKGRHKLPSLNDAIAAVLGDEKNGITAAEAILMKWRGMAIKGNLRAGELLLNRGYGTPAQPIQHTGPDGSELAATWVIQVQKIDEHGVAKYTGGNNELEP